MPRAPSRGRPPARRPSCRRTRRPRLGGLERRNEPAGALDLLGAGRERRVEDGHEARVHAGGAVEAEAAGLARRAFDAFDLESGLAPLLVKCATGSELAHTCWSKCPVISLARTIRRRGRASLTKTPDCYGPTIRRKPHEKASDVRFGWRAAELFDPDGAGGKQDKHVECEHLYHHRPLGTCPTHNPELRAGPESPARTSCRPAASEHGPSQ